KNLFWRLLVSINNNTESVRIAKVAVGKDSLITVDTQGHGIRRNEVGHVCLGKQRMMGEGLRVRGSQADMQVFEDTDGLHVGDDVEMSGEMLSVVLGPGILGRVFDGLENPLHEIAQKEGFFLPRGVDIYPLDRDRKWNFVPTVSVGDKLSAG